MGIFIWGERLILETSDPVAASMALDATSVAGAAVAPAAAVPGETVLPGRAQSWSSRCCDHHFHWQRASWVTPAWWQWTIHLGVERGSHSPAEATQVHVESQRQLFGAGRRPGGGTGRSLRS